MLLTDHWHDFYGGGRWQVKYDRLYNRVFDNLKLNQFIETSTFSDTKQALSYCVKSFIDNPKFLYVNWQSEAKKGQAHRRMDKSAEDTWMETEGEIFADTPRSIS